MRNDVKLGFAIGGVLLAVLIVYVLVVPGGSSANKQVSTSNGKVTLEPVGGGAATTQPSAPPAAPPASFTPQSPAVPSAASNDTQAAKTDALGSAGDASDPAKDAATAEASKSDTSAAAKPASGNGNNKDIDWNKLLNEQPMAMAQTPVAGSVKGKSAKVETSYAQQSEGEVKPAVALAPVETPRSETLPQSNDTAPTQPPADKQIVESTPPSDTASSGAATTQPSSGAARTHQVRAGETLSTISAAAYGSPNLYPAIIRANPGIDANHLKVGTILKLPDVKSVRPSGAPSALGSDAVADARTAGGHVAAASTPLTNKQYRVASGDSLYKISIKLYGKSSMAQKIYDLNKQTIGEDSHKLKVGQVLELPEAPTVTASTR